MYYLQSRYYDPELGRFINADAYASTGKGLLGFNMFAYCRNNPVRRVDKSGSVEMDCIEEADDDLDVMPGEDDLGYTSGGSGGGAWAVFTDTMKSASNGLSMAFGEKTGTQNHHFLSNKHSRYTAKYKEVTDKYGLDLNDKWNVRTLDNHRGRHTNAYHEYMLQMLYGIDGIAQGNQADFLYGFSLLADYISTNTWIPYAK